MIFRRSFYAHALEKAKQLAFAQGNMAMYHDAIKSKNIISDIFAQQGR
jgi:hypothetical protein